MYSKAYEDPAAALPVQGEGAVKRRVLPPAESSEDAE